MTLHLLRSNFFVHGGQEYEVQAALIDDRTVRNEATVFIRVLDRDRNIIALHYEGPAAPPRTAKYEVSMSVVQNAKLQRRLLTLDPVSDMMELAEDDVKRPCNLLPMKGRDETVSRARRHDRQTAIG